jgi:hypothetical protein
MVVCPLSFDHCVVCSSSIYGFWWTLWYLLLLDGCLSFVFWPLCCLFFLDIRILMNPLVSSASRWLFVLCLLVIVSSLVLYVCLIDHCLLILFWSSCCLFFLDIRILMNPLVSSTSTSRWLFVLFLLAIVLSVLLPYTDSDYLWYLQTLLTRLLYSSLIGTCRIYYADRTNTWIYYLNVREGAIENWQSRETGNIEFTRQRQKQQKSKKQDTTQMSDTELKRIHLI